MGLNEPACWNQIYNSFSLWGGRGELDGMWTTRNGMGSEVGTDNAELLQ